MSRRNDSKPGEDSDDIKPPRSSFSPAENMPPVDFEQTNAQDAPSLPHDSPAPQPSTNGGNGSTAKTVPADTQLSNGMGLQDEVGASNESSVMEGGTHPRRFTSTAMVAQQKFINMPNADNSDTIVIEPSDEEQQAFDYLIRNLPSRYSEVDVNLLMKAYVVASYAHRDQHRQSGEPYMLHPIAVTTILGQTLYMDPDTLAAGLLHDVAEDTEFGVDYILEHFGESIANMVNGVTKLKRINQLSNASQGNMANGKAESLRKMFLAMVEDVRVVIIKLADRLHNMRTLGGQSKHKRKRIARETLDIFAPLANRLGIWQVKWELEDLSFRYVHPEQYRELARNMQHKRSEREKWVKQIRQELEHALSAAGISATISGRPKHIYSIWRKMQRKDVDFDRIYDIHGFRVIVDTEAQCYAALGVVHSMWRPIPGEFDDYIANPKDNLYRSLHTAVLSSNGRPMEIQIRTHEMHDVAERGIAAHWQYKEEGQHDAEFNEKIAWIRQIMEWRQDVTDADEFMDGMRTDVFKDRVYVFTPQGDVIDLPAGATPIDLAYTIHTELGHRCRGANVNGRLVSLDYKLQNGDQVNIITAKRGGPSRDWLNPNLEYVATQRARSKIRSWLRKQNREENIHRGRILLDKEMKRLSVVDSFESIMKLFGYEKQDDFFAAIGYGEINSQHLAQRILEHERSEQSEDEWLDSIRVAKPSDSSGNVQVQGIDGIMTNLARCCNAVPGDSIIGYVTRDRGVTIHRTNCPNIVDKVRRGRDRQLIEVQWKSKPDATFPVNIRVSAYDRSGLMRDFASLVADEKINMLSVEALTGQKDNLAIINATLEIEDIAQLTRILTKIDRLPNVVEANRRIG